MRLYSVHSCTPVGCGGRKSSPQNYLPVKHREESSTRWVEDGYLQKLSSDKKISQGVEDYVEIAPRNLKDSGSPNTITLTAEMTPDEQIETSNTASPLESKPSSENEVVLHRLPTPKSLKYILSKANLIGGDQQVEVALASQSDESSLTTPSILSKHQCGADGMQIMNGIGPAVEAEASFVAEQDPLLHTPTSNAEEYTWPDKGSKGYQECKEQELVWPSDLLSSPKNFFSEEETSSLCNRRVSLATTRNRLRSVDISKPYRSKGLNFPTQKARRRPEKKETYIEGTHDVSSGVITDFQPFEFADSTNTSISFHSPLTATNHSYSQNTKAEQRMASNDIPLTCSFEEDALTPDARVFRSANRPSILSVERGSTSPTRYTSKKQPVHKSAKVDLQHVKHFRMQTIGMPTGEVQNAMKMDRHDLSILKESDAVLKVPSAVDLSSVATTNIHRFCIKWEVHEFTRSNSLWALCKHDPDVANFTIDEAEIKKLFSSNDQVRHQGSTIANGNNDGIVKIIDSKRANNFEIMLAKITLSYAEIARAIENLDQDAMSSYQVQGIIDFIPTVDERSALRSYLEDPNNVFENLSECEKFMVTMMPVKNAKQKLGAILFVQSFPSCLEELRRDARLVQKACDEIINSARFRKILGIILSLGNQLNAAGGRKAAEAFSAKSLLKLKQAKAFDGKTTFLHFVVRSIRRNKASLIHFKEDMPSLCNAEKTNWSMVLSEINQLEKGLDEVRKISLDYSQTKMLADDTITLDSSLSLAREVELLQLTAVGRFTLDACLRVTALVSEINKANDQLDALLQYFEEGHVFDGQPDEIFQSVYEFGKNFDAALHDVIHEEKTKVRKTVFSRGYDVVVHSSSLPDPEHERGPKSLLRYEVI